MLTWYICCKDAPWNTIPRILTNPKLLFPAPSRVRCFKEPGHIAWRSAMRNSAFGSIAGEEFPIQIYWRRDFLGRGQPKFAIKLPNLFGKKTEICN